MMSGVSRKGNCLCRDGEAGETRYNLGLKLAKQQKSLTFKKNAFQNKCSLTPVYFYTRIESPLL